MNDTISRQAAITALTFAKETGNMKCGELKGVIEVLNKVPSAEPKRIRGKWIHDGGKWKNRWICSKRNRLKCLQMLMMDFLHR